MTLADEPLPEDAILLAYCGECGFNSRVCERWIL